MARTGEARAFGNALIGAIYRDAGGDGQRAVRVDDRRAAQICTGETHPTQAHIKYVRELLHQLCHLDFRAYHVRVDPELQEFVIEPRHRAPTRIPREK